MSECIEYEDQGKEMGANRAKYVRQKNGNKCIMCIKQQGCNKPQVGNKGANGRGCIEQ